MDIAHEELNRILSTVGDLFDGGDWTCNDLFYYKDENGYQGYRDYYYFDNFGVNEHGDTALHRMAAMHVTASAVRAYLDHLEHDYLHRRMNHGLSNDTIPSPQESLLQQNNAGATMLHVVLQRNSWHAQEVTQTLLSKEPSLVSLPMHCGTHPLHILCGHNVTIRRELLATLLEADPSIVLKEDVNGDTPLSLLYKNVLRFRWVLPYLGAKEEIDGEQPAEGLPGHINRRGLHSWQTVICRDTYLAYSIMLVRAGLCKTHISLSDICSMPRCPPLLVQLVLEQCAGEARLQDSSGRLPLHYAAPSKRIDTTYFSTPQNIETKSVLRLIFEAYPEGVFVGDNIGRLPLHYALVGDTSYSDLQILVNAYPSSLQHRDAVTGLYPFALAAPNGPVDIVYRLLRSCPELLRFYS